MHLVGPWLTTTSYKKRKSKGITQRDRDAQKEHNKFLKSLGIDPNKKRQPESTRMDLGHKKYKDTTTSQTLPEPVRPFKGHAGQMRSWKETQERLAVSKQYSIVPAYNKGPYMVVSKQDLKTAGKKV
tara:strand:+ start:596 stop:976 length:381 start_codon:yes stop_codon:yes gene_type:complete